MGVILCGLMGLKASFDAAKKLTAASSTYVALFAKTCDRSVDLDSGLNAEALQLMAIRKADFLARERDGRHRRQEADRANASILISVDQAEEMARADGRVVKR